MIRAHHHDELDLESIGFGSLAQCYLETTMGLV
jgi:hypothetical protein